MAEATLEELVENGALGSAEATGTAPMEVEAGARTLEKAESAAERLDDALSGKALDGLDHREISTKLGAHIGGSRADRAAMRDSIRETRWMRSWKIMPATDGTWRVESKKLRFRTQFKTKEQAEDALARDLASRLLEPARNKEGVWFIRRRRAPQIRIGQMEWNTGHEAEYFLRDSANCRALLQEEAMMTDEARNEAARMRREQARAGIRPFPKGWSADAVPEGWILKRQGYASGEPPFSTREDALDFAERQCMQSCFKAVQTMKGAGVAFYAPGRRSGEIFKDGFSNVQEAKAWMAGHADELLEMFKEQSKQKRHARDTVRIPVKDARRNGPPRRLGHAEPAAFLDVFGFRGVEFGLWNNQEERQALLDMAWDALHDLAELLDVPPKALSLGGELSLAFGARGGGNAAAHYEFEHAVINLTKKGGAGCLAHEWMHAFDHFAARQMGIASAVRMPLVDGGTGYAVSSPDNATLSCGRRFAPAEHVSGFDPVAFTQAWKEVRQSLYGLHLNSGLYRNSLQLDSERKEPYWSKPYEMLARAFEASCEDRIEQAERVSEFLVNGTNGKVHGIAPYPQDIERALCRDAFKNFFKAAVPLLLQEKPEQKDEEQEDAGPTL